jgi:hypothetical protein
MTVEQPGMPAGPPPGWYGDPNGMPMLRWWDGAQWGSHTQPLPALSPGPQQAAQPVPPQTFPVQVNQQVMFPRGGVTRRPLGLTEHCFHAFMTLMTGGLWGFVWWHRVRMQRSYTTFG